MGNAQIGQYIGSSIGSCLSLIVAVVGALITIAVRRRNHVEIWIRWWFAAGLTLLSLQVAVYELLLPHQFAASLGYTQSQSMVEEAAANLGFAFIGFCCIWLNLRARWVVMIGYGLFLYIDLINHLINFAKGDTAPGNVGGTWVVDALYPIVGLLLLWAAQRSSGREAEA
jgi:hypothetical protein